MKGRDMERDGGAGKEEWNWEERKLKRKGEKSEAGTKANQRWGRFPILNGGEEQRMENTVIK